MLGFYQDRPHSEFKNKIVDNSRDPRIFGSRQTHIHKIVMINSKLTYKRNIFYKSNMQLGKCIRKN